MDISIALRKSRTEKHKQLQRPLTRRGGRQLAQSLQIGPGQGRKLTKGTLTLYVTFQCPTVVL